MRYQKLQNYISLFIFLLGTQSFAGICEKLSKNPLLMEKGGREFHYLCQEHGLEALRIKGFTIIETSQKDTISTFFVGNYQRVDAKLSSAETLSRLFCKDFSSYREIAPEAFSRVKDIETSNQTDAGCDFHFIGKKLFTMRPEFLGQVHLYEEPTGDFFVSLQRLTETISMVQNSSSLDIIVANRGFLDIYTLAYSRSDTKGFHELASREFIKGFKALNAGVAEHIGQF